MHLLLRECNTESTQIIFTELKGMISKFYQKPKKWQFQTTNVILAQRQTNF